MFAKGVNRQYSDQFAITGAKIGASINIRLPNKYFVRKGAALQAQNTQENTTTLTLTTQYGVDVNFSTAELTLSLDDFSQLILTPAMARLTSQIDQDGLQQALNVYNVVGTPGTTPGAAQAGTAGTFTDNLVPQIYLNAGVWMTNNATPRDSSRRVIVNPKAMASSVSALTGLWQDSQLIAEQYRKGVLGVAVGFEFAEDQNVYSMLLGAHGGTPVVNNAIPGGPQSGAYLYTSGWTPNTQVLLPGEIFTIGTGVTPASTCYSLNPENQASVGSPQSFVVTGYYVGPSGAVTLTPVTSDASGNATIPIYPSIVLAGAQVANANVDKLPINNTALTFLTGTTASAVYPQNLAYHQDAFTLGTADLELPGGLDFGARETYDGISMRIIRQYDINGDQLPCRIDVLAGWATLRPEFATRITG